MGTDAFDVSPFRFYLKTRLRHKLLGLGTRCASGPRGAVMGGTTCPVGGGSDISTAGVPVPASFSAFQREALSGPSGWKGGLEGCVCEGTGDTGRGGSRLAPGRRCGNAEL